MIRRRQPWEALETVSNRRVSAGADHPWSGAEKRPQRLQRIRKEAGEGRGWRSWEPSHPGLLEVWTLRKKMPPKKGF